MISPDTTIEELYKLRLLSGRAMNACRKGGIKTFKEIVSGNTVNLLLVKNCGHKTLTELDKLKSRFCDLTQDIAEKNKEIEKQIKEQASEEAKKKLRLLSPNSKVQLKSWVKWKFEQLNVRAKKAFPDLAKLSEVITIVYSPNNFNALDVRNFGKKTQMEIQEFLDSVRLQFEKETATIDITSDQPAYGEMERVTAEMGELYPFLLTKECERVARHRITNGTIPFLYIALLYILRSYDDKLSIFQDFYGLNTEGKRFTISEISDAHYLSRERIRQLINDTVPLPETIEKGVDEYLSNILATEDIVAFNSTLWGKVKEENILDLSDVQCALLVCSLAPSHAIVQVHDDDIEYLVRKDLIKNIKIRTVTRNLLSKIALRHTKDEELDILSFLIPKNAPHHKDAVKLCGIYATFIKNKFGLSVKKNRYVIMPANTLDISIAIENILQVFGKPMSIDDILQSFNTIYPNKYIDDSYKLKPYIFKNPNIIPLGKRGMYVLNSWSNYYTGSLTEYIEKVLHTFNEPLSLDNLVSFVLEEFPQSNKKSIHSLIVGDRGKRFIVYEGDYIGTVDMAASHTHPDIRERKSVRRGSFDSRFDELEKFVGLHKRFPILTGSEEERPLARWINNILKHNIECTDEQLHSFMTFIEANKDVPQNGREYKFKENCDQIKVIVAQTFALPDADQNQREYLWFSKNLKLFETYTDNRKRFFEDLLTYLKDFGFYF